MSAEELATKQSPEFLAHLKSIGRKKGDPKVPGSGSKATPKETKEWLAGRSQSVAELLYNMAFDENIPAKERMRAAMWIAEMSMSKAPVEQEIKVSHTHDIGALLQEAKRLAAKNMIDVTPTPKLIEGDKD